MPDPPVVDPRLNCAAGICCDNPTGGSGFVSSPSPSKPAESATAEPSTAEVAPKSQPACASHRAQAAILIDAGVPEDDAPRVAANLRSMGIAFTSIEVNDAIRRVVLARDEYSDHNYDDVDQLQATATTENGEPQMLDPTQLLEVVVRPTLATIEPVCPGALSIASEQLVMGTAAKESRLQYLRQIGAGPAMGLWQIEPATETDVWDNWLRYRPAIADIVRGFLAPEPSRTRQLATNLAYGCAMCRLVYYRRSGPLPKPGDVDGLAELWKRVYNTRHGAGTVDEFKRSWKLVAGCW